MMRFEIAALALWPLLPLGAAAEDAGGKVWSQYALGRGVVKK